MREAMEKAGQAIYEEYEQWKRSVPAHEAPAGASLHQALTEALKECVPAGPVRAFLQMEIERTCGSLRESRSVPLRAASSMNQDPAIHDALAHFQGILDAIHEAADCDPGTAAQMLREAGESYTHALTFLPEAQVHVVEQVILTHSFTHSL